MKQTSQILTNPKHSKRCQDIFDLQSVSVIATFSIHVEKATTTDRNIRRFFRLRRREILSQGPML